MAFYNSDYDTSYENYNYNNYSNYNNGYYNSNNNYYNMQDSIANNSINSFATAPNNVDRVRNDYSVNGANYNTQNGKYVDNHYTKYNNYYVNNVDYITDYVYDYNVYHVNNSTVYRGTQYMGARNVYTTNGNGAVPSNLSNASYNISSCNNNYNNGCYCN